MIRFNVIGQTLKRTDEFTPASDSVEFLKAQFNIVSDEWDGYALTALFRHYDTGKTYRAVLDFDGVCVVPWEVLTKPAKSRLNPKYCRFYVTLTGNNGVSVATTNEFEVEMRISGYTEGEEPAEPTPDAYAQYVEVVKAEADKVEKAAADVKSAAQTVEKVAKSNETTAGIIKNSAANAFKGTASGEVVRVDDVSPLEHTANVWVHGKNLWKTEKIQDSVINANGFVYTYDNGVFSFSGTTTTSSGGGRTELNKKSWAKITLPKGTYTYSINIISGSLNGMLTFMQLVKGNDISLLSNYTFTLTETSEVLFGINKPLASGVECDVTFNIQLELGETATEYTPCIDPSTVTVTEETTGATYTPNADGTCEVVSVSPTMTLLTDTEGVTIECEYNRDTNIVMGDVETAVDGILAIQNAIIGGDYS